jgi:hypothetical protein
MTRYVTKKRLIVVGIVAVTIGLAAGALAYFTSNGSGTGTAAVGSATAIVLSSPPVGTLFPGGADVPVTVTIQNPGSGAQFVNQVSGTVADNGTCLGSWFQVDTVTYGLTLAPGASDTATTAVRMLDSGTNQDACQGLSMTINWTSN